MLRDSRRSSWLAAWLTGAWISCPVLAQEAVPGKPTAGASPSARSGVVDVAPPAEWGEDYQIRVFGGKPYARVMFASYARELRRDFRNLVYRYREHSAIDRDAWAIPIRIELHGEPGDVYRGDDVRRRVRIGPDDRFVIQVFVRLHDGFEEESFRLEMLEALLIEQMLMPYARNPETLPVEEIETPSWLVHGFDQMIEHRRNGRPSAFYEGFLQSGQMLAPEEILSADPGKKADPVTLAIFRASSSALMEALLDQDDGDIAMRSLLGDLLAVEEGKIATLLRQHFPALREIDEGLEKWWALQVAALGQQQGYEFLDREETERYLDEAVTLDFPAVKGGADAPPPKKKGLFERLRSSDEPAAPVTREAYRGTLADHSKFLDRPEAEKILTSAFNELELLRRTAFPAYHPVISGYEAVIQKLIEGKTKTVDEDLRKVAELRQTIRSTLEQAEDYMNFFEATRAPQRSREFDEYMQMRRELEKRDPPRREDRISRYLDSLEKEFR